MDTETTVSAAAPGNRTLAILSHIGGLFTCWVAPLIIFLISKSNPGEAYATEQAKEALNFQLTVFIVYFVLGITIVGMFLFFIPMLWNLILSIMAAVKASNGEHYKYPLTIRFIK